MHEEHASKLHQTQTHHPRRVHVRRPRFLDTTGGYWKAVAIGHNTRQDGTYSFADFATAFEEYDVQRVIRSYENSISVAVHCCQEGEWKQVILHSTARQNFYEGLTTFRCWLVGHHLLSTEFSTKMLLKLDPWK
jgi:hypothetical protein